MMNERGKKATIPSYIDASCCVFWKMSHYLNILYDRGESHAVTNSRIITDIFLAGSVMSSTHQEVFMFLELLEMLHCHLELAGR